MECQWRSADTKETTSGIFRGIRFYRKSTRSDAPSRPFTGVWHIDCRYVHSPFPVERKAITGFYWGAKFIARLCQSQCRPMPALVRPGRVTQAVAECKTLNAGRLIAAVFTVVVWHGGMGCEWRVSNSAALEFLPDSDHRQGVELAVVVELLAELLLPLCGGFRGDGFLVGQLCHVAVLNAVEVVVGKIRA